MEFRCEQAGKVTKSLRRILVQQTKGGGSLMYSKHAEIDQTKKARYEAFRTTRNRDASLRGTRGRNDFDEMIQSQRLETCRQVETSVDCDRQEVAIIASTGAVSCPEGQLSESVPGPF